MLMIIKVIRIINYSVIFIDYIYINFFEKIIKFGICLVDIFDYLFCFCIVLIMFLVFIYERYYRDFFYFDKELFEEDLVNIDFYNFI